MRRAKCGSLLEACSKAIISSQHWYGGWGGERMLMSQHQPLNFKKSFVSASAKLIRIHIVLMHKIKSYCTWIWSCNGQTRGVVATN